MNVGYFSINQDSDQDRICWENISSQQVVEKGEFFKHVRFEEPLLVRMDGKKGMAVISMNQKKL
jgi:hypothetical protein